jgi:hypothetical protein
MGEGNLFYALLISKIAEHNALLQDILLLNSFKKK